MKIAIIIVFESGIIKSKKNFQLLTPSILAASKISSGRDFRSC